MDVFAMNQFLEDKPAIEENPTMFEDLWNKPPMMLIGLGLAGIAIIVAAGIGCWKMFAKNEETSKDEPLIDEPLIEPTMVLRNRNVNRQ